MTPYFIAYFYYFFFVFIGIVNRQNLRVWILIASVPMIALTLLRGLVGVDLPAYVQFVDLIRAAGTYTHTFEPLFEYVVLLLAAQIYDSSLVLVIISALTTVLLYFGSNRLERRPYLFGCLLVPYFYLDMTMNGIRYGLAYSVIIFAASFLIRGNKKIYLLLTVAASFIHITSALLALLLLVLVQKLRWRILILSGGASLCLSFLYYDYFLFKITAHSSIQIQSLTAGLAPAILSFSVLIVFMALIIVSATQKYTYKIM